MDLRAMARERGDVDALVGEKGCVMGEVFACENGEWCIWVSRRSLGVETARIYLWIPYRFCLHVSNIVDAVRQGISMFATFNA